MLTILSFLSLTRLATIGVATIVTAQNEIHDDVAAPSDIAVLYAGFPGGEREKHFVEFLEEWFGDVETIDLQKLNAKSAEGFDVVVADWKPHYKDGSYQEGSDPTVRLGSDYSKPTIAIGTVGTTICGGKLDWL